MSTIKSQNGNKPMRRQAKPKPKHNAVIKTNMGVLFMLGTMLYTKCYRACRDEPRKNLKISDIEMNCRDKYISYLLY